MLNKEEKKKIKEFLYWLDTEGFNFYIIDAIEKLLLQEEDKIRERREVLENMEAVEEIDPHMFPDSF